jgi:colicin import membrane protein
VSAEALDYRNRREPAFGRSFLLALAVHAILVAVIFTGVRWQTSRPDTVTVELWDSPPPPPPPVVEAPRPPPEPPKAAPEPPKPEPKIEKPQIVEKAPPPKPKPKPKPKPEPKPKPKPEAKPKPDPQFLKRMQEEAAVEQAALEEQNRVREAREARETAQRLAAAAAAAANKKAVDEWVARIRSRVKSRMGLLPPNLTGNPEAIFDVVLLPSGDLLSVRMRKSSGHGGYDDVVERAIRNSTPFPKPDNPGVFQRELELKFRPKDE